MPARTVLITGGSRGIGAAIAAVLVARGDQVVTPSRASLDLASADSIEQFLAGNRELPVDILINNAGINLLNNLAEIPSGDWQAMLQTNLNAALRLTQAYVPGMRARKWGRILNLSTIFSVVTKERRAAYSMTKAALNALTRSTAVEYGPDGILANALAPGYVDTHSPGKTIHRPPFRPSLTTFPCGVSPEPRNWPKWPPSWSRKTTPI